MRAVIVHVRDAELAERRAKGLDRWDEMWEGVLHMTPAPNREHQRILAQMITFLFPRIEEGRGTLLPGVNVFRQDEDYRIPDLTFVAAGRKHILREDGVRGEAPDAVLEIRSPGDETYEKLPFFAALGVRDVLVCHRDTKAPEVFRLAGTQYVAVQPDPEGWLTVPAMGVRFRRIDADPPRLRIEDLVDPNASVEI